MIQTWAKAYGEIADVFIQIEKEIYNQMLWSDFQPFKIVKVKQESAGIKSCTIESSEYDLGQFESGQYITVDVSSDKLPYRAKRHYSIVKGDKNHLTFGVKRDVTDDNEGEVSTILHDEVKKGDMINLSTPVGGFILENTDKSKLPLGSGIGITPLVAMFDYTSKNGIKTQMIQLGSDENHLPFRDEFEAIIAQNNKAKLYTHPKNTSSYLNAEELEKFLTDQPKVYICGGARFLKSMTESLKALDYNMEHVHYETFVPRLSVEA